VLAPWSCLQPTPAVSARNVKSIERSKIGVEWREPRVELRPGALNRNYIQIRMLGVAPALGRLQPRHRRRTAGLVVLVLVVWCHRAAAVAAWRRAAPPPATPGGAPGRPGGGEQSRPRPGRRPRWWVCVFQVCALARRQSCGPRCQVGEGAPIYRRQSPRRPVVRACPWPSSAPATEPPTARQPPLPARLHAPPARAAARVKGSRGSSHNRRAPEGLVSAPAHKK
jgi:hypothetical protein